MKIVHINTYDNGGAFNAAYRLHHELKNYPGIDSKMLVIYPGKNKNVDDYYLSNKSGVLGIIIKLKFLFFKLFNRKAFPNTENIEYTFPSPKFSLLDHPFIKEADIIHLHWVAKFFDHSKFFQRIRKPVFWTFHDENAYLKGFHYEYDKKLASNALAEYDHQRKNENIEKFFSQGKYTIITPSRWLHQKTLQKLSSFKSKRVHNIPYLISLQTFKPREKIFVRRSLKLNPEHLLIFIPTGSNLSPRKGNSIARAVIKKNKDSNIIFLTTDHKISGPNVIGISYIKNLNTLIKYYQAVDITFFPSMADNLPNIIIESMACGTPCIAFNTGGNPDLIQHNKNGFLVNKNPDDVIQLLKGLKNNRKYLNDMGVKARKYIEEYYNKDLILNQFIALYTTELKDQSIPMIEKSVDL